MVSWGAMRDRVTSADLSLPIEGMSSDLRTANGTESSYPYQSLVAPQQRPPLSASEILEVCRGKSLVAKAELLFEARSKLAEYQCQEDIEGSSFQIGQMVMLPTKGTAYFMSDLEGRSDLVAQLIDRERLIERWRKNDPNDQVFLCILGDIVDRNTSSSLLVDLLLELKCRHGFSRNILILSGNHEVTPSVQKFDGRGLYQEITTGRTLPLPPAEFNDPIVQELINMSGSPEIQDTDERERGPGRLESAREGLWKLYNEVFSLFPTSIVTPQGGYFAHAGFPVRGSFEGIYKDITRTEDENRRYLTSLARYAEEPHSRATRDTTADITWSNLTPELDDVGSGGMFGPNWKRGIGGKPGPGVAFGLLAFEHFASIGGFTLFLRGHQVTRPEHPSVQRVTSTVWRYGSILTIANGMKGGYAVLDLAITNPDPDSVGLKKLDDDVELDFSLKL